MKIDYRSLQTDTRNEATFISQEIAALAAGRQDKMWNFLLTFVYEQRDALTEYATGAFLADVASKVPRLNRMQWLRDREDPWLARQVVRGMYSAYSENLSSTPSFLLGFTDGQIDRRVGLTDLPSLKKKIEFSLERDIESLRQEDRAGSIDIPILRSSV